ncbi:universal stress protein [Pseudoxanthobacter sp.]|uniref:universal stress protein n=1 Tax=Pseudoxanthobacter sp. TaxID=1925742 RepID=UPI002FDFA848
MTAPLPSRPPRRILLATDLSARCDRALDRATALATAWKAELIAVHALEGSDEFYADELERRLPSWRRGPDAAALAERQLRQDMLHAGPDIEAVVERAEPAELILRTARQRRCELIVTGLARDETFGRFGLGATVDALLTRAQVPFLVVRRRAQAGYRNILVATDFSGCSRAALQVAMGFFPDRRLSIFHAYAAPAPALAGDFAAPQEDYRKAAASECLGFLADAGIGEQNLSNFNLLMENGRPSDLIHQYVRDRGVDLVVVGTHGRGALYDLFLGSTAKDILATMPCDVLVVREPGAAA